MELRAKVYRFVFSGLVVFYFMASMGVPRIPEMEAPIAPQAITGSNPAVCIAFDALSNKWGDTWNHCPAGYAFFGGDNPSQTCCPLPAKDILTNEHVEADTECPADYVATGNTYGECTERGCKARLFCTKIDTSRFQLGGLKQSLYWGDGFSGWQGAQRITYHQIPAAIRYAMGRSDRDKWNADGCVGYPFGSLLAKRTTPYCSGIYYRELQFSGRPGDPPKGTPVQMFPRCDNIENISDPPNARCVRADG